MSIDFFFVEHVLLKGRRPFFYAATTLHTVHATIVTLGKGDEE